MPWMLPVGWHLFMWTTMVHTVTAAQAALVAAAAMPLASMAPLRSGEVVPFPPSARSPAGGRGGSAGAARIIELRRPSVD